MARKKPVLPPVEVIIMPEPPFRAPRRPLVYRNKTRKPGEPLLLMHPAVMEIDMIPYLRDFIRIQDDRDPLFGEALGAYIDQRMAAEWDAKAIDYEEQEEL